MANSPRMPANMPIAQQRVVRGNAFLRLPGKGFGPDLPRFSWPGVVDFLDTSPGFPIDGDMTLVEAFVVMSTLEDDIEFDILVGNVAIDTVVATPLSRARYDISVPVVVNDWVSLQLTDFGAGICDDLTVVLRPFITVVPGG